MPSDTESWVVQRLAHSCSVPCRALGVLGGTFGCMSGLLYQPLAKSQGQVLRAGPTRYQSRQGSESFLIASPTSASQVEGLELSPDPAIETKCPLHCVHPFPSPKVPDAFSKALCMCPSWVLFVLVNEVSFVQINT